MVGYSISSWQVSLLKRQNAVIVQSESSILESCVRSYCLIAAIMFDFRDSSFKQSDITGATFC